MTLDEVTFFKKKGDLIHMEATMMDWNKKQRIRGLFDTEKIED